MKARALLLGIALIFAAGSPAFAQDDEEQVDPTREGWYVGASVGVGIENFSDGIHASNGFAGDFTFGYRANPNLSVEVQTEFLENFDVRPRSRSEIDIWTSTLNFRVHFPIEDSLFEPYMTYGVGVMDVETTGRNSNALRPRNSTDLVLKAGLGVAYQLSNAVSLYTAGSYALPLGSIKQFDNAAVTVGILYKFEGGE